MKRRYYAIAIINILTKEGMENILPFTLHCQILCELEPRELSCQIVHLKYWATHLYLIELEWFVLFPYALSVEALYTCQLFLNIDVRFLTWECWDF